MLIKCCRINIQGIVILLSKAQIFVMKQYLCLNFISYNKKFFNVKIFLIFGISDIWQLHQMIQIIDQQIHNQYFIHILMSSINI